MKIIKYVFALILIMNNSKSICMQLDEMRAQIREIGRTADIQRAQKLLDSGMDIEEKDNVLNYNMLLHAMSYLHETDDNKIPKEQRLQFVDFLIKNGTQLEPKTDSWQNIPMLKAVNSNIGVEFIDLLINHGANVNITHPYNDCSALHLAAWNGHVKVVNFLLRQKDIQINVADNEGRTPLIKAAFWGYIKVVKELLKHPVDTTVKDSSGRTAFDYAISCSEENEWKKGVETMKCLLTYDDDNFNKLTAALKLQKLTQNQYDKIIGYGKYKIFSKGSVSPGSPVQQLPREIKGNLFEYLTGQELTPTQKEKLMQKGD